MIDFFICYPAALILFSFSCVALLCVLNTIQQVENVHLFFILNFCIFHFQIIKLPNPYCPVYCFEGTGLRKMALRKLAYGR